MLPDNTHWCPHVACHKLITLMLPALHCRLTLNLETPSSTDFPPHVHVRNSQEELQLKGETNTPVASPLHIHNASWTLQFSHTMRPGTDPPCTQSFFSSEWEFLVKLCSDRETGGQAGPVLVLCSAVYCKLYLCKPFILLGSHTGYGGRGEQSHAKNPF